MTIVRLRPAAPCPDGRPAARPAPRWSRCRPRRDHTARRGSRPEIDVEEYISGCPMLRKGLECPVSKLVDSDACPRPTAHLAAEEGLVVEPLGDRPLLAWGDNSVSTYRSYSRAKGAATSAEAFPIHPMPLSLSGKSPRGPRRGAKGSCETPRTP
jgi:hypothetical protein